MNFMYQPTALEEAYGEYLLENVFQITGWGTAGTRTTAHPSSSSTSLTTAPPTTSAVRIAGRQAVPFFTKSGVDRTILRDVWSTVDPHNRGYLDDPIQFHASLKLIVLAQTGMLQHFMVSTGTTSSSSAVMEACLLRASQQDSSHMHLPVFEGISIPDASFLLHRYGKAAVAAASALPSDPMTAQMTTTAVAPTGPVPARTSFTFTSDPFASLTKPAAATPSSGTAAFGGATAGWAPPSQQLSSSLPPRPEPLPTVATVSISDAFGDLVEIDDKPLPSLVMAPAPQPTPAVAAISDTPPHDPTVDAAIDDDVDDDDDFGDFVDPTTTTMAANTPSADEEPPSFNAFGAADTLVQDDPTPAPIAAAAENTAGSAAETPVVVTPLGATSTAIEAAGAGLNDSSEFGDFCGSEEFVVPVPQPQAPTGIPVPSLAAPTMVVERSVPVSQLQNLLSGPAALSVDLLFPSPVKPQPKQPTAEEASSSIPGFGFELSDAAQEFLQSQPAQVSAGDWDALDALAATVEDAPLPSLAAPSVEEEETQKNAQGVTEIPKDASQDAVEELEDDFGDCVAISSTGRNDAEATEAPTSVGPLAEEEGDGFGDFVGTEDVAVAPELKSEPDGALEAAPDGGLTGPASDDVGPTAVFPSHGASKSWDGTETVNLSIPVPLERRTSAPTPVTQGWGAFDALGIQSTSAPPPAAEQLTELDTAQGTQPPELSASGSFDAFDEILGITEDAPLPSLSQVDTKTSTPEGASKDGLESIQGEEDADAEPSSTEAVQRGVLRSDDRQETEFYSASGSASEDSEGFQSAAESEGENVKSDAVPAESSAFAGAAPSLAETAMDTEDDPFAALDALSSPPPELPPLSSFVDAAEPVDTPAGAEYALGTGMNIKASRTSEDMESTPAEASESDTFGDFESAEFDAPTPVLVAVSEVSMSTDNQASQPVAAIGPDDSFGDFAGALPANTQDQVVGRALPAAEALSTAPAPGGDGFLAFDAFAQESAPETPPAALDSTAATADGTAAVVDDEEFGDFAAFSPDAPVSLDVPHGQAHVEPTDSSWDDFQEAAATGTGILTVQTDTHVSERESLLAIRSQVVELSEKLSESLRRQTDGQLVDFGDCFDANLGLDVPVSEERMRRAQACLHLLERLTSHPGSQKLASTHWEQSLRVARDELTTGTSLLEDATRLGATDFAACKAKLETYEHGLGEYVRVARSIVASIGDVLLLDASAMFTIDTLASSWCNLALLELALGIEQQWRELERLGSHLGLVSKQLTPHKLDTVEEIRRRANEAERGQQLCEFTLQPLAAPAQGRHLLTKSTVHWRERSFMACAANFLRSSCSFYVVEP